MLPLRRWPWTPPCAYRIEEQLEFEGPGRWSNQHTDNVSVSRVCRPHRVHEMYERTSLNFAAGRQSKPRDKCHTHHRRRRSQAWSGTTETPKVAHRRRERTRRCTAGRRRCAAVASSRPARARLDAISRCRARRQQIRDVAERWWVELAQCVVGVHHPHQAVWPLGSQVSRQRTVQLLLHLVSVAPSVQH